MNSLNDFDYDLPQELIAQSPLAERDQSRLMILNKSDGSIDHKQFFQVTDYLKKGDVLVFSILSNGFGWKTKELQNDLLVQLVECCNN